MKCRIYKITLPNGMVYIGQTKNHPIERWGQHLLECKGNRHGNSNLQESYNKGELDDWLFEVIEEVEDDDKAYFNLLESHYIALEDNLANQRNRYANSEARREVYREKYREKNRERYRNMSKEEKNEFNRKCRYRLRLKRKASTT